MLAAIAPLAMAGENIRFAVYNAELERDGPGLLLRDIVGRDDAQLAALSRVVAELDADVLLLLGVDFDHDLIALNALRDFFAEEGSSYPYVFALPPNSGLQTGIDMDGDERVNRARDGQGYGEFYGQGAKALLSRFPIQSASAQDFTEMLWRDLPGARLPQTAEGQPFPSPEAQVIQRLSSTGHWVVPIELPAGMIHLMTFHATPPVFDGPEDMNGKRNHDEWVFWRRYLDGAFGLAPEDRFILMGGGTIDPIDGEGLKEGIAQVLSDDRLQDPKPMRPEGDLEDSPGHKGDARLDTVAWDVPDPGHLRASYVLPSAELSVSDAGVFWPSPGNALSAVVAAASRHRPVWVDISFE